MEMMLEKESVVSNSSSTILLPPILGPCSTGSGGRRFAFSEEDKGTSCFYCQKQGHWVRDCPAKSPKTSQPSSSPVAHALPNIHCPCGAGICIVLVSRTAKNPGRKFYRCPLYSVSVTKSKCKFFKWCDMASSDEFVGAPMCRCGAGICRIYKEISEPNAGREFFVCPVKKGQGACNFIQPLGATNNDIGESMSTPQSTLTNCHDTGSSNSDTISLLDTPEHRRKLGIISETSRKDKVQLVEFHGREDTSDAPLRKRYKCLRHGAPNIDGLILDSTSDCQDMPQSKSGDPTSKALIHQRQAEFLRQISSAATSLPGASSTSSYYNSSAVPTTLTRNCLETATNCQIVGYYSKGWCGRLLFPPSRCLTFPAPNPFFCCVFPSFDPIIVPRDVSVYDAEKSIGMHNTSSVKKLYLLTPIQEPSGLEPPTKIPGENIMSRSILEVFEQAAVRLQDELLTRLESMDFCDHESMFQEANSVFGALERLFVDYEPFKERVTEFIGCAASLDKIELSIHKERDFVDKYDVKRLQLEDISRVHAETSTALDDSNQHLQSLRKEASRVKDMLLQIEDKLSSCEAENMEIATRLDQITEDMLESELCVEVASEAATEALKLCQQREAEWNFAKASFEKARSKLR